MSAEFVEEVIKAQNKYRNNHQVSVYTYIKHSTYFKAFIRRGTIHVSMVSLIRGAGV